MFHLKMISLNIGGIAGAFFAVFFFCVVCKVRLTAVRKLNQSQNRKW